jgi:hypothetical protein
MLVCFFENRGKVYDKRYVKVRLHSDVNKIRYRVLNPIKTNCNVILTFPIKFKSLGTLKVGKRRKSLPILTFQLRKKSGFVTLPGIPSFHDVFRPFLAGIRMFTTFSYQLRISETLTNAFRLLLLIERTEIDLSRIPDEMNMRSGAVAHNINMDFS